MISIVYVYSERGRGGGCFIQWKTNRASNLLSLWSAVALNWSVIQF